MTATPDVGCSRGVSDPHALDPRLLQVFAAVVRAGSVSRAAPILGISKSVVSRRVAQLESELGAQLLRRTTREMSPTELGAEVLRRAEAIEAALVGVHELVQAHQGQARGSLRVACSGALGHVYLVPLCIELAAEHPELDINLHFEERFVDLVGEGFDVALRFAELADSSLRALKLAEVRRVVVAAPAYLARHGTPSRLDELRDHRCVLFCTDERVYDEWTFTGPDGQRHAVRVQGQLRLSAGLAMVRAAVLGAGVLCIDRLILQGELERGELVPILPGFEPTRGPSLYALYSGRERVPRKTRAFLDRLKAKLVALDPDAPRRGPALI